MKKSTLLAIAALAAGIQTGFAADEVTLPGGLVPSTKENPVYYTISNMRADRLSYITAEVYEADHETYADYTDPDMYKSLRLPEYLPDENETPEIWTFPYMGLARCENKYWTAFSAQKEVMDPLTIYWWFEKASGNGVYIHNAIIDGALKSKADRINGRPSMSFSESAKQTYYVLPLNEEELEDIEMTDDPYAEDAFAFSKTKSLYDKDGNITSDCLDMNNYITYNWISDAQEVDDNGDPVFTEEQKKDADGNPMYDEDGEPIVEDVPVYLKYGFAGVNLTWNPLNHGKGGNENYRINNGSLFKVEKVTDLNKVEEAISKYEEIVKGDYQKQVANYLESSKADLISQIETLKNLPAIYDADKVDAIIASLSALNVDVDDVSTMRDVDVKQAQIDQDMEGQYLRAVALAKDGTVITLQQMLAMRDWSQVNEEENVGNAFLSAAGAGEVKYDGSMEEIGYAALTCLLEENLDSEALKASIDWTLEWVMGQGYRLKNGDKYIRQFGNWTGLDEEIMSAIGLDPDVDFGEGENLFTKLDSNVMSWALTEDENLAAIFSFVANDSATQEVNLSDSEAEAFATYGEDLGYNDEEELFVTTNICHLQSTDPEGNATWLCRDNANCNYIVDSWSAGNRFFANPNCWKIALKQAGEEVPDGIEEINAAAKVAGIYDLQGRKVAKAGKGLYIINGVKTLVK